MSNVITLPGIPVDITTFLKELLAAAEAGQIVSMGGFVVTKEGTMAPLWTPMEAAQVFLGGEIVKDYAMSILRNGGTPTGYERVSKRIMGAQPAQAPPDAQPAPSGKPGLRVVADNDKEPG